MTIKGWVRWTFLKGFRQLFEGELLVLGRVCLGCWWPPGWKSPIHPFICHCYWRGGCSGNGFTTAPLKIFGWCHTCEENDTCFICHVQKNCCLSQWGYSGMAIYFETVWKYRNSASFWRLNLWLLAAQLLLEKNNRKTKSSELEKKHPSLEKRNLKQTPTKLQTNTLFKTFLTSSFLVWKKIPASQQLPQQLLLLAW